MRALLTWLAGLFRPTVPHDIDSTQLAFALKASGWKPTFRPWLPKPAKAKRRHRRRRPVLKVAEPIPEESQRHSAEG